MANNYTQSSEYLEVRTQEELDWLNHQLATVYLTPDNRIIEEDVGMDSDQVLTYTLAIRFLAEACVRGELTRERDWLDDQGFEIGPDSEYTDADEGSEPCTEFPQALWVRGEEGFNFENVGILVQQFLKKFQPNGWWTASWAHTCSKLRVGEFSGGAMLVTANAIEFVDAQDWVWQKAKLLPTEGQR